MRVLITGAAGFIGSHLGDRLLADGHKVLGIDNLETGRRENFPYWFVDIGNPDRTDLYKLAGRVEPELVIHCAASYKDPDAWHRDVDTNVAGTINAINVAKYHKAKLVYFQTALPPISSYAISKIAAEQYIRLSGVPSLIFRLSNIYGPRNLSGPIPAFYKRLAAGERCTVVETTRDMVYIDDLVDCVVSAIQSDLVGTFHVCSGEQVPIGALFQVVAEHFPDASDPVCVPPSRDDVMPQTNVHEWLRGWRPRTPLGEGIASAVEWYRENGVGDTYTHLKVAS